MQGFPFSGYFSAKLFHALADTQPVHCFVAHDHYRPGERAASLRVVGRSFPPNIGESLLQHVLSFFGIIQHPLSHRVQRTGESLVKRYERRFFPIRNPGNQARFDLVLGFLIRSYHIAKAFPATISLIHLNRCNRVALESAR
jgi:hypothetical protein